MANYKSILFSLFWVTVLTLTSCRKDIVYTEYRPVVGTGSLASTGWHMDSLPRFDYTITDKDAAYSILVYVRHTERYPYQNMWLFIQPDSLHRDTIEFYLADDRGQWLGDKHNGFIEMPVLYESNYHYPDTGHYSLVIQHGMRDSLLRGITDVGVEIIKSPND